MSVRIPLKCKVKGVWFILLTISSFFLIFLFFAHLVTGETVEGVHDAFLRKVTEQSRGLTRSWCLVYRGFNSMESFPFINLRIISLGKQKMEIFNEIIPISLFRIDTHTPHTHTQSLSFTHTHMHFLVLVHRIKTNPKDTYIVCVCSQCYFFSRHRWLCLLPSCSCAF